MYRGTVVRLMDYGALMLLAGSGAKALLHISEVSPDRIRDIGDVLQVGWGDGHGSTQHGAWAAQGQGAPPFWAG